MNPENKKGILLNSEKNFKITTNCNTLVDIFSNK